VKTLAICLFFVAPVALAVDVPISWVNATDDVDGQPLPATGPNAIERTSVGWYLCVNNTPIASRNFTEYPPAQTTATITIPDVPGDYCINAWHQNNAGLFSDASNEVIKTVAPPAPVAPKAPTSLQIN